MTEREPQFSGDQMLEARRFLLSGMPAGATTLAISRPAILVATRATGGFLSGPGSDRRRMTKAGIKAHSLWRRLTNAQDGLGLNRDEAFLVSQLLHNEWDAKK